MCQSFAAFKSTRVPSAMQPHPHQELFTMTATQLVAERLPQNPLDLAEQLIMDRDWLCDRPVEESSSPRSSAAGAISASGSPGSRSSAPSSSPAPTKRRCRRSSARKSSRCWRRPTKKCGSAISTSAQRTGSSCSATRCCCAAARRVPEQMEDLIDIAMNECKPLLPGLPVGALGRQHGRGSAADRHARHGRRGLGLRF